MPAAGTLMPPRSRCWLWREHQLGRREQALAALDKAEAVVAKKMGDPSAGRPFGRDWDDWLRCRILLDEARKLRKKDSRAKNQESGKKPD